MSELPIDSSDQTTDPGFPLIKSLVVAHVTIPGKNWCWGLKRWGMRSASLTGWTLCAGEEIQKEEREHRSRLLTWAKRSLAIEELAKVSWKLDMLRAVAPKEQWT